MSTQNLIEENKTLKKQLAKLRASNMELAMKLTTTHEELGKYKKVVEVARKFLDIECSNYLSIINGLEVRDKALKDLVEVIEDLEEE